MTMNMMMMIVTMMIKKMLLMMMMTQVRVKREESKHNLETKQIDNSDNDFEEGRNNEKDDNDK